MKIIFYNNKDETIVVNKKNITPLFEIDGTLREGCSIYNPVIQIKIYGKDLTNNGVVQSIELAKLIKSNYAYVEDFSRYYYIDDIIGEYSNVATLFLKCDVLMSFKDYFKELNVFASRNEYSYNKNVYDSDIVRNSKLKLDNKIPSLATVKIETYADLQNPFFDIETSGLARFVISGVSLFGYDASINTLSNQTKPIKPNFTVFPNEFIVCDESCVIDIYNWLLSTTFEPSKINNIFKSEPVNAVGNVMIFPFDITKDNNKLQDLRKTDTWSGKYVIRFLGNTFDLSPRNMEIDGKTVERTKVFAPLLFTRDYSNIVIKEFTININKEQDLPFLYFSDSCRAVLYLPFYGFVDIPNYLVVSNIYIAYFIDIYTGDFDIVLSSDYDFVGAFKVVSGNCCYQLPFTAINKNEIARNKLMAAIKGGKMLANLFTGGYEQKIQTGSITETTSKFRYGKKGNMTSFKKTTTEQPLSETTEFNHKSFINDASDLTMTYMGALIQHDFSHNSSSSLNYWFAGENPRMLISYPRYYIPNGYDRLVGRPTTYSGKLKGLFGYTEIVGVHIEGDMGSASQLEKEEIEQSLKTGVILPNPKFNSDGKLIYKTW